MAERVEVVVEGRDQASGRHDVVLLARDARMSGAWLDKLRRCAASDERIGAIVPWHAQTLLPACADVEAIDAALARSAPCAYPDVEDIRGPCLFVRGRVLREIGGAAALRDRAVLRGAVADAGFRSVLCDDVYAGGAPNGPGRTPRSLAPIARLARTQIALDVRNGMPGVLHVLHSRGGGTEKYVQSVVSASRARLRHYFLRVHRDRWLFKDAIGEHGAACEWPRDLASEDCLRMMCDWLRIGLIHVHSLVGSGDDLVRMLASTGLPYCYSVHDMYAPCPTVYLIDASGGYCNATTDLATCTRCLGQMADFRDVDIARWRARYAALLRGADRVFAPSQWAGDTLRKYYPDANIEVRPHPVDADPSARREVSAFELPQDACRHVAVLGAIGPEKGARVIDALADEIRARSLPLRIVVVGFTDRARRWQSPDRTLTIHGSYAPDEVAALLERYRIDLVFFPTTWPETFSYTLSEAWRSGRPALVPPRGALAERVQATGAGWLMHGWPGIASIADQLVELTSARAAAELHERGRVARAAANGEANAAHTVPYDVPTRSGERSPFGGGERHEIYVAACRAMSVRPHPRRESAASRPRPSPLERLLRFVARA